MHSISTGTKEKWIVLLSRAGIVGNLRIRSNPTGRGGLECLPVWGHCARRRTLALGLITQAVAEGVRSRLAGRLVDPHWSADPPASGDYHHRAYSLGGNLPRSLEKVHELLNVNRRMRRIALESAVGQEAIDLVAAVNALRVSFYRKRLADF